MFLKNISAVNAVFGAITEVGRWIHLDPERMNFPHEYGGPHQKL